MECGSSSENQVIIAREGGIKPLIELLSTGSVKAKDSAAGALQNLSVDDGNTVQIAKEGGIKPFIQLVLSGLLVH